MHIELINTGSELLLGRVLNTHQQWICRQLADVGREVTRQWCVADDAREIQNAVRESLSRSDLVITTGGLGPTSDDITRDLIAQLLGRELVLDPQVIEQIEGYFRRRNRPYPERVKLQAMVPLGARVLPNQFGTAPGLALEVNPNPFRANGQKSWLILLPGPPRELRPMFVESVLPLVAGEFPPAAPFVCRTLKTTGIGESLVEEKVAEPLRELTAAGLQLGYCARPNSVDVRLVGRGPEAQTLVERGEAIVRRLLGPAIWGSDDESIEMIVVKRLSARSKTLALAESCTGGDIAHHITDVPGASKVLLAGLVTYSNQAKQDLLGVSASALEKHGAVSGEVAREMADGARRTCGSDYAIAVTGIAGPDGGSAEKPVGLVYIAVASPEKTVAERFHNPFDRATFKEVTVVQALNLLLREMGSVAE